MYLSYRRTSLEQLRTDITKLDSQITKIQSQMKNPNTKDDVKRQMNEFLPVNDIRRRRQRRANCFISHLIFLVSMPPASSRPSRGP